MAIFGQWERRRDYNSPKPQSRHVNRGQMFGEFLKAEEQLTKHAYENIDHALEQFYSLVKIVGSILLIGAAGLAWWLDR
jgi:hypothetical protein